jgi:hypothetical protein
MAAGGRATPSIVKAMVPVGTPLPERDEAVAEKVTVLFGVAVPEERNGVLTVEGALAMFWESWPEADGK